MKSLIELESEDCRYPFGDETFLFCGEVKREKSSYCEFHHRLCWIKPASNAPKARKYHGTDFAA